MREFPSPRKVPPAAIAQVLRATLVVRILFADYFARFSIGDIYSIMTYAAEIIVMLLEVFDFVFYRHARDALLSLPPATRRGLHVDTAYTAMPIGYHASLRRRRSRCLGWLRSTMTPEDATMLSFF